MDAVRITTTQVAKLLQCSVTHVHKIPASQLPYTMVGTHRRYDEQDVRWYLGKQRFTGEASGV